MALTSATATDISAALAKARKALADYRAAAPTRQQAAANGYLATGKCSGEALADVIMGLLAFQKEARYSVVRAAIDRGASAITSGDKRAEYEKLYFEREALERDVPGIAERYAAAHT